MEYNGIVKKFRSIFFIILFYWGMTKIAHTLLVTSVTYYSLIATTQEASLPNTVNEITAQFLFFSYAVAALAVSLTLWFGHKALYQVSNFWNEGNKKLWELSRDMKQELQRGMGTALLVVVAILGLFFARDQLSFLGFVLSSTVGTPVFPLFFLDLLSIGTICICEEYIFRYRIMSSLMEERYPVRAVVVSALLYLVIKAVQFDLGLIECLNILLINISLGFYFLRSYRVHRGIGFIVVFFALLKSVFGLALWSQAGPSMFLFKHNAQIEVGWLTGGDAGPLAGLGMTSLLAVVSIAAIWSWRQSRT